MVAMSEASTFPATMNQPLQDRVILITGASGGLGNILATACAQAGATTVLLGRSLKKLEALYDRIEAAGGPQPAMVPLNHATATLKDFEQLAITLEQEFGRLDGLVHCAAHFKGFSRLEDLDPREWLDTLQINLTAPYALTRLCLPALKRSGRASVVHVLDRAERTTAFRAAYGVAQAATQEMIRSWASEWADQEGLRINGFDPGPMRTELRARGYPGESSSHIAPPENAVARLLWLLGDDSAQVNGRIFCADDPV